MTKNFDRKYRNFYFETVTKKKTMKNLN